MKTEAFSSSPHKRKFDVFLSFSSEDTRTGFARYLYQALRKVRLQAYKDDERLEKEKIIDAELLNAIEESGSAIVVLSKHYVSSTSCLDELVHIIKCYQEKDLKVYPVLYDVEPTEVGNPNGNYGMAFAKHEEVFKDNMDKITEWRKALDKISTISGWDLTDRNEADLVQMVEVISRNKDYVGMNARLQKVNELLDLRSENVRTIGICGAEGVGKTIVAQLIFEQIRKQFEASCFVKIVKNGTNMQKLLLESLLEMKVDIETPLIGKSLLRERLCSIKVLIVLDDVEDFDTIEQLVGEYYERAKWLGLGSRVVITSRDKYVLEEYGVNNIYKVDPLSHDESRRLLYQKAFNESSPSIEYNEDTEGLLKYAKGLPLAIKVLGSFLHGRSVNEWMNALTLLNQHTDEGISNFDDEGISNFDDEEIFDSGHVIDGILKVSFDGLKDLEKAIFLDIACCFNDEHVDVVKDILRSFEFHPETGLSVLESKSLITLVNGKIQMHDRLVNWCVDIARGSRLRADKRRGNVLHYYKDEKDLEVIDFFLPPSYCVDRLDSFKMPRLRLLRIQPNQDAGVWGETFWSSYEGSRGKPFGREYLANPQKIEMEMEKRCKFTEVIETLIKGEIVLEKLTVVDFSRLQLNYIPDFSMVPNLERLYLGYCKDLLEVHPSVGHLQRLVHLDLHYWGNHKTLTCRMSLKALRELYIRNEGLELEMIEIDGNIEQLSHLHLQRTHIRELRISIGCLTGLTWLDLSSCNRLSSLPSSICSLTSLKTLNLSGCKSLEQLPENIGNLNNLESLNTSGGSTIKKLPSSVVLLINLKELDLSFCREVQLPNSLSGLSSLEYLNLSGCNLGDGAIPDDIGCLSSLKILDLSRNNFVTIPESISSLSQLETLHLNECCMLRQLPKRLPSSLKELYTWKCPMLATDSYISILVRLLWVLGCSLLTWILLLWTYQVLHYSRHFGDNEDHCCAKIT